MGKNLKSYSSRRDFAKTPEPPAAVYLKKRGRPKRPVFVVQKHSASHLHYDFRLEISGVLVSWAIPKGPPLIIGEKRLAIQTEDHPLEYAQFAGKIPEGEYGAGTVKIWDHGYYNNIKTKDGSIVPIGKCLQNGHIEVYLYGKKVEGPYTLIKTKFRNKDSSWLIIKMKIDQYEH